MMREKCRILLVDDHGLVRRGFRRILEDEADLEVVGEASSGTEAIELARKLKPHVVLMDCALQGESGIQATREIVATWPEMIVLMLSMHSEETLVRQSLEAGARGYILKNAVDLDLSKAVRRAITGEIVIDPQVRRTESLKGERAAGLTARELEVLQLIAMGKSNKEIASDLDLSVNTIAVHRANIMNALGLHKTAELVVYAIRNGLVNLP
jgi:DNA-binding NarL/FixJ family response regulator